MIKENSFDAKRKLCKSFNSYDIKNCNFKLHDLLLNRGDKMNNSMQNNPFGNFMNFMQQVSQFAQTVKGNPQDIIQNKLNSGQISQEEYNQKYQQAQQAVQMMQMFFGGK